MIAPEEIWKAIDECFIAAGLKPITQGTKWEGDLPKIKVVADVFCPEDIIYFIDENGKLYVLKDIGRGENQ